MNSARVLFVLLVSALTGCATQDYVAPDIGLESQPDLVAESALLDIGIVEFSPGLPSEKQKLPDDVYPDIRKAE
ncbi:MAG: hypothetical protein AAAFM81_13350, partial [Pseudomonadota bacterium]